MTITKSLGRGQKETLGSCITDKAEVSIKEAANVLQDHMMLARLAGVNLKSKEVKYRRSYRKHYLNRATTVNRPHEVSNRSHTHQSAF